jgi:hypothetical protein
MKKLIVSVLLSLLLVSNCSADIIHCKQQSESGYLITACHLYDDKYTVDVIDLVGKNPSYKPEIKVKLGDNVEENLVLILLSVGYQISKEVK